MSEQSATRGRRLVTRTWRVAPYVAPVAWHEAMPAAVGGSGDPGAGRRGLWLAGPSLVGSVVMLVASLGSGILTARLLGPDGRGLVAAAQTLLGLAANLGLLGLRDAVIFVQARQRHAPGAVLGTSLRLTALLSVPVTGLAALAAYGVFQHQGHHAQMVALLATCFCPVLMLYFVTWSMVVGRRHYRLLAVLLAGPSVVYTVAVVGLRAVGDVSTGHVIAAFGASYVPFLLLTLVVLVRGGGFARGRPGLAGELLRYGVRAQAGTLGEVTNVRLDMAILPIFVGAGVIGQYSVAVSVASMITAIFGAIWPVVLSEATARESLDIVVRATRAVLAGAVLCAVGLAATAWFLIPLVYGDAYGHAYVLLLILLPGLVAWSANYYVAAGLKSIGRPGQASLAQTYGLVITVVGLGVLLPTIGATGAAVTTSVAYVAVLLAQARQLRRASGQQVWAGVLDGAGLAADVRRMALELADMRQRR